MIPDPLSAVGEVAGLAKVIFQWVTDPDGYHEWSTDKKLEKLHEASLKAIQAKDTAALDLLTAEYTRLRNKIV
jgi:hypothetical protein